MDSIISIITFFLFIVTDGNKDETDKPTVTAALSVVDESVDESSTPVATSAVSTAGSKTIRISSSADSVTADQQKENKGESSSVQCKCYSVLHLFT